MRPVAALAVLFALLVPAGATGRADGWVTHRVPAHRFSLSLPSSWRNLGTLPAGVLERLERENPSAASSIRAIRSQRLVVFFAGDLSPGGLRGGFLTNVNVIDQPVPSGLGVATWARLSVAALRQSPIIVRASIRQRSVRLPAGPAVEFRYRERLRVGGRTADVAISQWGIVTRGHAYILTFSTLPSRAAAYAATFARSARSFRLG